MGWAWLGVLVVAMLLVSPAHPDGCRFEKEAALGEARRLWLQSAAYREQGRTVPRRCAHRRLAVHPGSAPFPDGARTDDSRCTRSAPFPDGA
ncbi:MAG: hypothetical protein AB1758_33995, partial [Candidatus Eremiobacterota bacterium]